MSFKKLHVSLKPDQSAIIPYRIMDGEIQVLLITTRNKGKWIVPKGGIEKDLDSHESAEQEALEEAGVEGQVSPVSIGCYRHGNSDKDPIVEVFLMRVERERETWEEDGERTRRWVTLDEAYQHVDEDGLKSILDDAAALIGLAHGDDSMTEGSRDPNGAAHPAIPKGD